MVHTWVKAKGTKLESCTRKPRLGLYKAMQKDQLHLTGSKSLIHSSLVTILLRCN